MRAKGWSSNIPPVKNIKISIDGKGIIDAYFQKVFHLNISMNEKLILDWRTNNIHRRFLFPPHPNPGCLLGIEDRRKSGDNFANIQQDLLLLRPQQRSLQNWEGAIIASSKLWDKIILSTPEIIIQCPKLLKTGPIMHIWAVETMYLLCTKSAQLP